MHTPPPPRTSTSWHLWSLEHGHGPGPRGEKDRPPSEDVAEVAGMIGLTLPASHASWVEVRVCVVLVWSVGWLVG